MKQDLHTDKNGTQRWYLNDQLHREDGPAIIFSNGISFWYINDRCVATNELEFKTYLIQQNLKSLI